MASRRLAPHFLLVFLSLCLTGYSNLSAQKLVVVEEGVARMPIVVFENALPFTRQAADRLADYIGKISGAGPEVIEGSPDPVPEQAIWVGYQPQLDWLFPEIDFNFQNPEEILIAANENHLVIAAHPFLLKRFQFSETTMIRRAGKTLVECIDPASQLQVGSLHRCVVENDEGTLRMIVDGKVVFEQQETANILGDDFDRVGVHSDSVIRIERVRVYVKRLEDGYI